MPERPVPRWAVAKENSVSDDEKRVRLRRQAFDLKLAFTSLATELLDVDPEAAASAMRGRHMAFETWSHLATPFDEAEEGDH